MKRILPSLLIIFGACSFLNAQTIDYSNFTLSPAFNDKYLVAVDGSFNKATTGSNQTWNYGSVTYSSTDSIMYYDSSDSLTGYPDVYHHFYFELLSPSGGSINAYKFRNLNASGFYNTAFYVEGYSESLSPLTGGANDVLDIPEQRITLPDSLYLLKFPVNNQSSWTSSSTRRVDFNLSVAAFNLSQTPGYFQDTEIETRTVIGDGSLVIPDENGNPLPPVDVFMIEVVNTSTDSVYLAGSPAPATLMSAFGLSQGSSSTDHFVLFYPTNGAGFPIAAYSLDANDNPFFFTYRPQVARNALGIGINEVAKNKVQVYPNPLRAEESLNIQTSAEAAYLSLYNLSGQSVLEIDLNESPQSLSLRPQLKAGLYLLHLKNADSDLISSHKIQIK